MDEERRFHLRVRVLATRIGLFATSFALLSGLVMLIVVSVFSLCCMGAGIGFVVVHTLTAATVQATVTGPGVDDRSHPFDVDGESHAGYLSFEGQHDTTATGCRFGMPFLLHPAFGRSL